MRTKLVTLLILLTCSFSFSSCDRDDYDEDYLEGIWWSVDDYYDVIRLNLNRNGMGTCEETYYDRYGYAIGSWYGYRTDGRCRSDWEPGLVKSACIDVTGIVVVRSCRVRPTGLLAIN